jgi:cobalt-zinc-cadmium efflux system outer membrane protein
MGHADVVPPPVEIPAKITLDDALTTFRAHGFGLLIADAAVMNAEGVYQAAGYIPNPSLNASYGRVFNYNSDTTCNNGIGPCGNSPNAYGIGISDNAAIEDSIAGKRHLRKDVQRAALAAAKMNRVDAQRNLEFQVKSAYMQIVLALDSLDFQVEVAKSNKDTLDLNQKRYDKGAINEGDLARVRTAKLESDQAVDSARQAVRQARIALAFLLGVRGHVPEFDIDRDALKYRIPASLTSSSPDTLLKTAIDKRPDLRALGYQRESAEAQIHLAKRLVFPDIAFSVNYNQTGTGSQSIQPPTLTFGLSAPIPILYQQQGEVRQAEANYNTQALSQAQATAQVVSDVETAYAAFAASKVLVERMEGAELSSARTARDITERQFKGGTATLMDFLDAQRTYIATNLEYLQDLTSYWTAVFQLEPAIGGRLRSPTNREDSKRTMNARSKRFPLNLALATLLSTAMFACGASNEEAPAPPPPPVDPTTFQGTPRPPAAAAVIAPEDLSDAGNTPADYDAAPTSDASSDASSDAASPDAAVPSKAKKPTKR